MLQPTLFDVSSATITETDNNVHISSPAAEQDLLVNQPVVILYSPSGRCFYSMNLPDCFSQDDQVVGVFHV